MLLALTLLSLAASPSSSPSPSPTDTRPTVAILYFDNAGKADSLEPLRKGLTQMLISDVAQSGGARIVERERLEAVLAELKLSRTQAFDAATAARAGKLLAASHLVLGSYFDLSGTLRLDARLIEVETGRILKAFGATGKDGDFLTPEQELAANLTSALAELPGVTRPSTVEARRTTLPPRRLRTTTAVAYGRALHAIDSGRKADAKTLLQQIVKEQPDFQLASRDLDRLIQ